MKRSCKRRGFCPICGARRRAGGALNSNIHYHMLFLDGFYITSADNSRLRFRWAKVPSCDELTHLTHTIAHRVARYLERQGLLERDAGLHRRLACLSKPIVQTFGCYEFSSAASFALQAGISPK